MGFKRRVEHLHWCDCGNPRRRAHQACDRCERHDGKTASEFAIVEALVQYGGPCGVDMIAQIAEIRRRTVDRCIGPLLASGRVRKWKRTGYPSLYFLEGGRPPQIDEGTE